jgi:hypothetical protein
MKTTLLWCHGVVSVTKTDAGVGEGPINVGIVGNMKGGSNGYIMGGTSCLVNKFLCCEWCWWGCYKGGVSGVEK